VSILKLKKQQLILWNSVFFQLSLQTQHRAHIHFGCCKMKTYFYEFLRIMYSWGEDVLTQIYVDILSDASDK